MTDRAPILVTGGTHGIGRATVERLTRDGCPVWFSGRDVDAGRAVEAATGARFVECDVTDDRAVAEAVDRVLETSDGRLAGLVNNAGAGGRRPFGETTAADWDRLMAVNARSAYLFTVAALSGLRAERGAVVMVSSVAGWVGQAGLSIYSASKAALIALSASLALECGREVRFNTICPGQIQTRMMGPVLADPAVRAALERAIPVGRLGTGRDVAAAVAWLLSPNSAFVNGSVLVLDGGETAGIGA